MRDTGKASGDPVQLSVEEFTRQAASVGLPPELREDLYPMVRDLRALADQINALTPELHEEIPVTSLRSGTEE